MVQASEKGLVFVWSCRYIFVCCVLCREEDYGPRNVIE